MTTAKETQSSLQHIILPMRKTLSLSTLFRSERAVRTRPSSDIIDDGKSSLDATVKRRRRLSLRRSPASTSSSLFSSPDGSPQSTCSSSNTRSSTSTTSRISKVASRCLFPDTYRLEEEDFIPPQRPACPAPFLDLSFDCLSMQDEPEYFHRPISTRLQSDISGRLSVLCPSEESFRCRGLEEDAEVATAKKLLSTRNRRRPIMTSILAPSALKLRPRTSFLAVDSDLSSPNSSVCSFETTPEMTADSVQLAESLSWHQFPRAASTTLGLLCPPSPPPTVRLQMTLPPTANLIRHLILVVDSNASTLELKEHLCSTLLEQFQFSISPSNIAMSFVFRDGEAARVLENSRPLYEEGLQDDDDILVRF